MNAGHASGVRVLHVLDTFEDGGAQRVALSLGAWSREHGCTVAYWGRPGPLSASVPAGSTTFVVRRPEQGFAADLFNLARAVRRFRPDVLHAHQRREALLALLVGAALGVPVVEHAHTELPSIDRRALSFRSRRIFAVSASVGRMVVDDYGRSPERVVVTGNAPANVSGTPASESALTEAPVRILGIGRLAEQKDPERFLAAVESLARSREVTATWLGDGPMLPALRQRALEAGVAEFSGPSADVTSALDAAHLLLSTSRWEGTPLVMLEAMARRRPVVATDVGGVGELLGGGKGLLVPAGATGDEIAAALEAALAEPDRLLEHAERAKTWVDAVASPDAVFGAVLLAYRELGVRR
ncbi:glycosyltransferase [Rathayibacter tanaceti]|uniref:D-inositol 3-phosphate glycosyltransferase n=2 Tax=Rathayibacter tanaceti TaxID=1671680 RepID=A0A162GQC2_9MICO|nr:glycosyltransferase [Rathayibacter tanaceti]KZX21128.1 Alpha-D-kanosaminyltransferase [Rathayibacter tanaceti]QHC55853.1 glycosyltransferase [Rathayibacter tanaceti]TCO39321.1 glycosyltransferase involved in cell wall biosynthesis [Rathayibacter tanaceti]